MASGGFIAARNQLGLRETGQNTTVPDTPKAHLMYYLDSISGLLELDNRNLSRFRDYTNHHRLSEDETDALLKIVILLSPDELIGKVLFPSDELCRDSLNKFYELSKATNLIAAVQNTVLVAGERKRVLKIMTFKMRWMQLHYIDPIKAFESRILRIARGLPGYERPRSQSSCVII